MRIAILDCYVDEPACLGVPPYMSPYPRYVAGAVVDAGSEFDYLTIDHVRRGGTGALAGADLIVIIGGAVVPGKYLRSMPASAREVESIAGELDGTTILACPLALLGQGVKWGLSRLFDHVCAGDVDAMVHDLVQGSYSRDRRREMDEWDKWASLGARVVREHQDFPVPLIVEIETYRGCVRYFNGGCSFCSEPLYGRPEFRDQGSIAGEVRELARQGITHFRLGGQSCFYSYKAKGVGETETPRPSPNEVEVLLCAVRKAAPALRVLHLDNANPAVMSEHGKEAEAITRAIVEHCTSGNVVALGLESADPVVRERNNLNATPEQVMDAIEVINRYGSARGANGLPRFLPGVNFVCGLEGETERTYGDNIRFLEGVVERNLLLRRINIRQVSPLRRDFKRIDKRAFRTFKNRVRETVDGPMLQRLVPFGTVLTGVYLERQDGNVTYGRQIGSYPLLVGIPYKLEPGRFLDCYVTSWGYRSITAVQHPFPINTAPLSAVSALPGIGRKRAARIVRGRPFSDIIALGRCLDDSKVLSGLEGLLSFS